MHPEPHSRATDKAPVSEWKPFDDAVDLGDEYKNASYISQSIPEPRPTFNPIEGSGGGGLISSDDAEIRK